MSVSSHDPTPGMKGPIRRWQYYGVPNGTSTNAFLAGHPFGCWCHFVNYKSLPCRRMMSDGNLPCPLCGPVALEWRGYTPWYNAQYARHFSLITSDYLESVREIAVFQQIVLSRAKAKKSPIVIRGENWRTTAIPESEERPGQVDLLPFLLRLWKDEELTAWNAKSDMPMSMGPECVPEPVARRSITLVTPAQEIEFTKRKPPVRPAGGDGGGMQLLGEALPPPPSGNGKHRKQTE